MSALDFLRIVDSDGDHIDVNHAGQRDQRALMFTAVSKDSREATAVALDEERVRELVAFAQAWLDAPRDAARAAAEVVVDDTANDVRLMRTPLGEWGVGQVSADFDLLGEVIGDKVAVAWCADERAARAMFAELRGKAVCECGAEMDEDEAISTEDGDVCTGCAAELHEEFKASRFRCPGCGWCGTGADIVAADSMCHGEAGCPQCETLVEGVEIEPPVIPEATP